MNFRVNALRHQIYRSVRATSDDPAESVRLWLKNRGYIREAENFDPSDYACLIKVEQIIIGEFCPALLTA